MNGWLLFRLCRLHNHDQVKFLITEIRTFDDFFENVVDSAILRFLASLLPRQASNHVLSATWELLLLNIPIEMSLYNCYRHLSTETAIKMGIMGDNSSFHEPLLAHWFVPGNRALPSF